MANVDLKQFKRTFSGGYSLNFPQCFEGIRDIKTKNYSNFYLADNTLLSDGFEVNNTPLKASNIIVFIKYGQDYLQFSNSNEDLYKYADRYKERNNYGEATFTNINDSSTELNLEIFENNICRLYFLRDYIKFYLSCDINNKVSFILESLLPNENATNPQDFEYLFSSTENKFLLFKQLPSGTFLVTKYGNSLILQPNTIGIVSQPFQLSRSIFQYPHISQDTSFITYTNANNIDVGNSIFHLPNNLLIHRSLESNILNPIVLKNQLLQNDVFSCCNTLISGGNGPELVNGLRDYTIISEDIKEETTDELELNYVFYNNFQVQQIFFYLFLTLLMIMV